MKKYARLVERNAAILTQLLIQNSFLEKKFRKKVK